MIYLGRTAAAGQTPEVHPEHHQRRSQPKSRYLHLLRRRWLLWQGPSRRSELPDLGFSRTQPDPRKDIFRLLLPDFFLLLLQEKTLGRDAKKEASKAIKDEKERNEKARMSGQKQLLQRRCRTPIK